MINDSLLQKYGFQIDIKEVQKKINSILQPMNVAVKKIIAGLRSEGADCTCDDNWIYVKSQYDFEIMNDKINNRFWLSKIARHRVYDDCKKCKHLEEEKHLGKLWCEKWDTDIWNINTPYDDNVVNKGCVPFRYFGYAPDCPMTQTQFHYPTKVSAQLIKGKEVITKFAEATNLLDEIGFFVNDGVFVGEFDNHAQFKLVHSNKDNKISLSVIYGDDSYKREYPATQSGLNSLMQDWNDIFEYGKNIKLKNANGPEVNTPRQETSYDWINSEEYKKRNQSQKSKTYDHSPSNVDGEKFTTLENAFGDNDKNLSNF